MKEKLTDIEILREEIELFTVYYFDSIEMSGSVQCKSRESINYLRVDLTSEEINWDDDLEKLHQSCVKHLKEWAKENVSKFSNYISISRLTVEYKLPKEADTNQNRVRHVKLFNVPSYFYHNFKRNNHKNSSNFSMFWNNVFLRNMVLSAILTLGLLGVGIYKIQTDRSFNERLLESYDYMNIASGIIASFVLGFLITKVITIRQDKLKYTGSIRELSNKLTYFRKICFSLSRDHVFWSKEQPFYDSYQYAMSIRNDVTFKEYFYPNYDDEIEYAKVKSFYRDDMSYNVVSLILQLHMLADESFLNSGLLYTEFPPDYIYSYDEMKDFIIFTDSNQIWYNCSEIQIFPETFLSSYDVKEIINNINRIYPENNIENLARNKLKEVSLDFQYHVIPRLFKLTRLVNSSLPMTIKYFISAVILLLSFGLIIPTLTYVFIDQSYALLSVFVVIGIIVHILLTLKPILEAEIYLDRKHDYL
ncbi:hypothetical protein [Marivirga arenosa]|uniref:Uncharacterized protein n=1 Tax=Marivirga arenosa TaxID=3059076 RepID=A0AA51ZXT7_9BACT|nr:hypothetical protein [Marivirga sp. BKB1-2]WNB18753.1 hypothetical protein QYS47_31220 [Marivirga sp. BKB1-2]